MRKGLLEKLQNRKKHAAKFKVVTQLGWNSGAYVFPDKIVGKPNEPLERSFGHLDPAMLSKYRAKHSLKEWQNNVATLCVGNSRLMFSVSLAFTGPILRFVQGPKSGGFQIYGPPETSKTTAAIVAGSAWGCHRSEGRREKGFLESWNTTPAKAELTALAHNDAFLVLDETKTSGSDDSHRAKVVTEVTFKLAEHVEKERFTNQQSARAWREYFLSTSNLSLTQLAVRGKIGIDEADRGRLADIPLPKEGYGIYEELHGFADGSALSDALQRRSRKYCGAAAREFVRRVVRDSRAGQKALKAFLAGERKVYATALKSAAKAENLRPLNRVLGRSATAFAAGSLAIKYGILPWNRTKLLQAVLSCELDHLRHAAEDDLNADPVAALRSKLVKYLKDHHAGFMNLKNKKPKLGHHKLNAVPGYRDKFKRRRWYYLTADQLKAIIGVGRNADALKRQLADEGLLDKTTKGRFVVYRQIFTGGKGKKNWARVHAIKAAICRGSKADG